MKCAIKRKEQRRKERLKKKILSDLKQLNPEIEFSSNFSLKVSSEATGSTIYAANMEADRISEISLPDYSWVRKSDKGVLIVSSAEIEIKILAK